MSIGPGDVIAGRYELLRLLGDAGAGRVYLAIDRHLEREVALRLAGADEPAEAAALLEEARRMAAAYPHSPAALSVVDAAPLPEGGGYAATELLAGTPLEEVARRDAPLPATQAAAHAVALLDACIIARTHVEGGEDTVVASAMLADDGRIRVTRLAPAPVGEPGAPDPAVTGTASTLRALVAGGSVPASLEATIDDALAGRVATPEELRGRLIAETDERPPAAITPPPPLADPPRRWPWIVAAIAAALLLLALVLFLTLRGDDGVTVPDVAGSTAAQAVATLEEKGFVPRTTGRASGDVNKGLVIETSPAAGTSADEGSEVNVVVSQGADSVVVPTVLGLSEDQASAQLSSAGLAVRVIPEPSASAPEDSVTAQDPGAGLRIAPGSTVAITVSSGPPPTTTAPPAATAPATITVPDVTGMTAPAAAKVLTQAGLQPGEVRAASGDPTPDALITSQNPAAGVSVAPGTAVDVLVASPAG